MGEILSCSPYIPCILTVPVTSLAQMTARLYQYKSGIVTTQIIKSIQSLPFPVKRNKNANNLVLDCMFFTKSEIFEKCDSIILREVNIKQYGLIWC